MRVSRNLWLIANRCLHILYKTHRIFASSICHSIELNCLTTDLVGLGKQQQCQSGWQMNHNIHNLHHPYNVPVYWTHRWEQVHIEYYTQSNRQLSKPDSLALQLIKWFNCPTAITFRVYNSTLCLCIDFQTNFVSTSPVSFYILPGHAPWIEIKTHSKYTGVCVAVTH